MNLDEFEKEASESLGRHRAALGNMENELSAVAKAMTTRGAQKPDRASAQLKEILKVVSTALGDAIEIIQDHADGTLEVSNGLLLEAARTASAAREVLDSIALVEAVRPLTR
jgi:hypothetical protein